MTGDWDISLRHHHRMGKGDYWGKQSFIIPFSHLVETPQTVFAAMSSENFKEHTVFYSGNTRSGDT